MMNCSTIDLLLFRLLTQKKDPFKDKPLILFGDPAVCRHDLLEDQVCLRCHISRSVH